jgi:hypothetical protein
MEKYIGVKEMLRKAEQRLAQANVDIESKNSELEQAKTKISSLEEQYKDFVSPDDHKKVVTELDGFKTEAMNSQRKSFADKYGLDVADIKDLSEEQLKLVEIGAKKRIAENEANEGDKKPDETKPVETTPTPTTPAVDTKPKPDLSSGDGSSVPLSVIDQMKLEIEEAKRK